MKTLFTILLALLCVSACASNELATADSLFQLRDQDFNIELLLADSAHVNSAIQIYSHILQTTLNDQLRAEALWKLLQAYYFKGQFCSLDPKMKKEIYNKGLEIGEQFVLEVPENVAVYSWMGVIWARWAEVYGLLAAARKGVANKVKYYGEHTIALDDTYLDAGGYRLLGMLNFSVPKIPFLLPWPSKEKGLSYLEKANEIAPNNLYNKMYLAEVLYNMNQKARAKQLLDEIISQKEIVHDLAIDSFIKQEAEHFIKKHY